MSPTKRLNKWLIGFIIGGAVIGLTGLSHTEKGRGIIKRGVQWFMQRGRTMLTMAEQLGEKMVKRP